MYLLVFVSSLEGMTYIKITRRRFFDMKNTQTLWRAIGVSVTIALARFVAVSCDNPTTANVIYHTITFNTGGGSAIGSVQVQDGQTMAMPTAPTRCGFY